jgi:YidC/Oxa1 family membrane protein insertase
LKPESGTVAVSLLPSGDQNRVFVASSLSDSAPVSARVYIGPRDYFVLKKAGLESAFPVGMLGQIGLILLMILNWIAGLTKSYGVAVILFSTLVTIAMAPMTLISLRSMKKMQELKPQMDRLMATHKGDTMKANQEVVALYRKHKVSPLSGCLPMLMQFPIFIALFQAMSHFIELRGRRFLWIQDLSLPDRIAQLPRDVPLIGRDVNLLPVLMAIAMMAQTKLSQQGQGTSEANPAAKMLSGPLMPIMFCVMFYSFPSGLVLYWLTNTLMSVFIYKMAYRTGSAQVCKT